METVQSKPHGDVDPWGDPFWRSCKDSEIHGKMTSTLKQGCLWLQGLDGWCLPKICVEIRHVELRPNDVRGTRSIWLCRSESGRWIRWSQGWFDIVEKFWDRSRRCRVQSQGATCVVVIGCEVAGCEGWSIRLWNTLPVKLLKLGLLSRPSHVEVVVKSKSKWSRHNVKSQLRSKVLRTCRMEEW